MSPCGVCHEAVENIDGQWVHPHSGDTYCGTGDGATAIPTTRRRLRTTQSRLGGNFIAVCDHCDYVCVYWDDDLDDDGHLYHDCEG